MAHRHDSANRDERRPQGFGPFGAGRGSFAPWSRSFGPPAWVFDRKDGPDRKPPFVADRKDGPDRKPPFVADRNDGPEGETAKMLDRLRKEVDSLRAEIRSLKERVPGGGKTEGVKKGPPPKKPGPDSKTKADPPKKQPK